MLTVKCTSSSPEHVTSYYHHNCDNLPRNLNDRVPTDLYPFYGHPAQAYTWLMNGIHTYTKAIQDGTGMQIADVIAKIVAEYAGNKT